MPALPPEVEAFIVHVTHRPDWRDAARYPADDAPLQAYGVEFARRRPGFERELRDWIAGLRAEQLGQFRVHPDGRASAPWGYGRVLGIGHVFGGPYWPQQTITIDGREHEVEPRVAHRMVLVFDMNEPMHDQIERARRLLLDWTAGHVEAGAVRGPPAGRHPATHRLRAYLRAHDARCTGETLGAISAVLLPGHAQGADTVRKWCAAARRYIDGDYRRLLPEVHPDPTGN